MRGYKEMGIMKDGDEIISTPITFVSTNLAIAYENMLKSNSNMNDSSYDISLEIKRIGLFYEIREAIELLINRGIEINVRDRQGDTSLDYAFKLGDIVLIKLLCLIK